MDSSQKKDLRKKVDMILDLHKTNPKLFYDLIVEANVDPISKETGMRKTSRKRKRSSIKSKKSKAKTPTAVTSRRTASKSRKSKKPNKSRIGKKPVASPFSATKLLRQSKKNFF